MKRVPALLFPCFLSMAGLIFGQTSVTGVPGPGANQAVNLPPQQLDNLVAPVALYPDPLLGQVLAASTYPVELVEAEQWLEANPGLQGQQLTDAARQQNWDASIQALVAMPQVLSLLTQDIRWTTDLGNAFLAQQGDVMSAVQRMRQRAQANGQLRSNQQETVTTQNQGGDQAIEIQPADPNVMYVPAYDPYYVYGYGAYPPLYYPDGYWFEPGINIGLFYGGWGGWGFGGWGWGLNWFGGRGLFVNNYFFNRYGYHYGHGFAGGFSGRTGWVHDPAHRVAAYPGGGLSNRFGAASQASRIEAGRGGNWHSFGEGNIGGGRVANSFAGRPSISQPGAQSTMRNGQGFQHFQGPQQNFRSAAPAQRFQTPQRSFQAPQRSFQAAPQSAPRMSAPSFGGGGGAARSFGGGGGGGFHSSAGGHAGGGGGSHGGGHR